MSIYYVYRVTNKVTNQFYIGSRTTKIMKQRTPEEDLWVKYFTSSKVIKQQIEQYGEDSFVAEVRFSCDDRDKVYDYEQIAIFYCIDDPRCLNRQYFDGKQKFSTAGLSFPSSNKGKAPWNKGLSKETSEALSRQAQKTLGRPSPLKGKPLLKNKGKVAWNKGLTKETSEALSRQGQKTLGRPSPLKGKPSACKGKKLGPQPRVVCPHCNKEGGERAMYIHHFNNCKHKPNSKE